MTDELQNEVELQAQPLASSSSDTSDDIEQEIRRLESAGDDDAETDEDIGNPVDQPLPHHH